MMPMKSLSQTLQVADFYNTKQEDVDLMKMFAKSLGQTEAYGRLFRYVKTAVLTVSSVVAALIAGIAFLIIVL